MIPPADRKKLWTFIETIRREGSTATGELKTSTGRKEAVSRKGNSCCCQQHGLVHNFLYFLKGLCGILVFCMRRSGLDIISWESEHCTLFFPSFHRCFILEHVLQDQSTNIQSAPPPRPVSPLKRPVSPLKRPASPQKSDPPVPPPARSNPRTVRKAPSRSNLKSTATDSEAEKAPPPAKRSTAKSTATAKTAKATAAKTSTSSSSSSSRTVKGLNSSGSLKENKVKGVKEEEERPATSASNGRRVLRARK